jgi:hypothetical protein
MCIFYITINFSKKIFDFLNKSRGGFLKLAKVCENILDFETPK